MTAGNPAPPVQRNVPAEALENRRLLKVVLYFSEKGALRLLNLVPLLAQQKIYFVNYLSRSESVPPKEHSAAQAARDFLPIQ
ncbi:MAG: hypothetical protein K2N80_17350 [Lachnospiraceae bacterium]|nr:hypothetical protein [Lachnospiraceae bacterium]